MLTILCMLQMVYILGWFSRKKNNHHSFGRMRRWLVFFFFLVLQHFNPLDSLHFHWVRAFSLFLCLFSMKITNFHVLIWIDKQWKWTERKEVVSEYFLILCCVHMRTIFLFFFGFFFVHINVAYVFVRTSIYSVAVFSCCMVFWVRYILCPLQLVVVSLFVGYHQFLFFIYSAVCDIKIEFSWVNIDFVSMIRMYLFSNIKR